MSASKELWEQPFHFIDVFSGAGGLSCGLEMAGLKCLLGVDSDRHAIDTFASNHKHAQTYCGDIAKLTAAKLKELLKDRPVHAVVGGPPCQGFSTVGTGNPQDERNSLFLQFVRIVRLLNPEFIVIENVTGLLAKKNEKILHNIFMKFEKLGYHLDVQVMSAEEYGAPEIRRRTIIIGTRLQTPITFPLPTHSMIKQKGRKKAVTVGQALKSLRDSKGKLHNHDLESAAVKNPLDKKRLLCIPEGRGIRYQRDEKEFFKNRKLKLNIDWENLPEGRFRQTKYFRLDSTKPAPTIMTHRHSYYHPTEPRFLTQREAAKLQSFPNHFIFKGPLSAQWRQIGNAVPPKLGQALGPALLAMKRRSQQADREEAKKKVVKKVIPQMRGKAFSYRKEALKKA